MTEAYVKEKYTNLREFQFDKLKHRHNHLFKTLDTYQSELKKYLVEDAMRSQELCISNTYLAFDSRDFNKNNKTQNLSLLGYITLTNDSINISGKLKSEFVAKGINYGSLPALKIGRLCVNQKFERRNIGTFLIAFAVKRACYMNQSLACRFITLDAMRHKDKQKDSLHFYTKFGFKVLEHKNKSKDELIQQTSGSTPMYFDAYNLIKKTILTCN